MREKEKREKSEESEKRQLSQLGMNLSKDTLDSIRKIVT